MKVINISYIIVLLLILFPLYSIADEGEITVCNISSYDIQFCENSGKIMLPCGGNAQSLYLNIIDTITLQIEKTYQLGSLIRDPHIVNSGTTIIVALSEIDGNSSTEEGLLAEIDYATGNILRELPFTQWPRVMVINNQETYAYILLGIDTNGPPEDDPILVKVDLTSFQIVNEVTFGEWTRDIEITPDGSKLYVQTRNVFPELSKSNSEWGIGVFDTSDLTITNRIVLEESPAALLEMSADGTELFIGTGYVRTHVETGASLYIVDTSTDQITNTLHFLYNGAKCETWSLAYDNLNDKLYCTAQPKDENGDYSSSNLILELDLTDYSYTFFEMGDNPLGRIALAPLATGGRLFAIESGTPIVHYKDVY